MTVLGDVIDNVVDGVSAPASVENFTAGGIYTGGVGNTPGDGFLVRGNRVRNLEPKGTGEAQGITTAGTGIVVRDNVIVQPVADDRQTGVLQHPGAPERTT